jgi:uncharacterized C2H2 Zn-finger protein
MTRMRCSACDEVVASKKEAIKLHWKDGEYGWTCPKCSDITSEESAAVDSIIAIIHKMVQDD